jgi:Domain of unknown function (DUF1906)
MRRSRVIVFSLAVCALAVLLVLPTCSHSDSGQSSFLGFDLNDYPGDDGLPVLRKTFVFSGYWLSPPPGEKQTNWLGTRSKLQAQGFGFAVLFNGRESRELKSVPDGIRKGESDASDAAVLARHEGFPPGTIVFLDIEEGGRLTQAHHEYVNAWVDGLAKANFRAGAYCSSMPVDEGEGHTITTVKDLQDHLGGRKLAFWIFNDACPPSPGCVFPKAPPPVTQGGSADATIWQTVQSPRRKQFTARCAATYNPDGNCYVPGDNAHKWFLDVDVASSANPSAASE